MAVSIRDVAKAVGVSVGTVSRAFNDYSDIKEETKQAILAAAKEIGYVPNLNAKILSAKNRRTMAVILAGFMADRGLTDELVIKILRGANSYAIAHNLELAAYVISSEQQKEKSFEQFCGEHSLTGAMCFGLKTTDAYYEHLKTSKIPCVTVDVLVQGENMGYVGTDNTRAFEEITRLVLRRNHKRLVFLNGRPEATVCAERMAGLQRALEAYGLQLEDNLYTDFRAEQAEKIVTDYIAEHGTSGATAFICASDLVALGASKAIRKCGYTVGVDFSVTGFDGLYIAKISDPPISTVNQNMEAKGYVAAELLHSIIDGRNMTRRCLVPYTVSETESVGSC